jgi:hypothetical protein
MNSSISKPTSLWRDRWFVLFWLTDVVSTSGSILTSVVLPILIFRLSGSALQTALLTTLGAAPYLWTSGDVVRHAQVAQAIGFAPDTQLFGFLYVGNPAVPWPESKRKPVSAKVRWVKH